jgi:hypothetical protein
MGKHAVTGAGSEKPEGEEQVLRRYDVSLWLRLRRAAVFAFSCGYFSVFCT